MNTKAKVLYWAPVVGMAIFSIAGFFPEKGSNLDVRLTLAWAVCLLWVAVNFINIKKFYE